MLFNDGIPEVIYQAMLNDPYSPGDSDITVTRLIDSPRIRMLTKRHAEEIREPASGRLWSLLGQAMHVILQRADHDNTLKEERLIVDFDGVRLGGQFDYYHDGHLVDFKITSAWSYVFEDGKPKREHVAQLNVLAELLRQHGFPVTRLSNTLIFRDWMESKRDENRYPPAPSVGVLVPLWTSDVTRKYIAERLAVHTAAEAMPDEGLPECSDQERWTKPPTFAVMKDGRKSAVRVLESRESADALAEELGRNHSVEVRQGDDVRCLRYCAAWQFCAHGREVRA